MKNDYSRVCIINSAYALFNYLLISTPNEIEDTFFFFSTGIPESCRNYFSKQSEFIPPAKNKIIGEFKEVYTRFFIRWKYPFIRKADFWGMTSAPWSAEILGNNNSINLVEDGGEYNDITETPRKFQKLRQFLHGKLYNNGRNFSDNKVYKKIYITGQNPNAPIMKLNNIVLFNIKTLWNEDEKKRNIIYKAFNITKEDQKALSKCKSILLTQTLAEDKLITIEEEIELYRNLVKDTDKTSLCIKTHPREYMKNYKEIFPESVIFEKKIPMQLLVLCFNTEQLECAYTVFSTALRSFKNINDKIKLVFLGTEIHPELEKRYGKVIL